jgi:hypothetical protein
MGSLGIVVRVTYGKIRYHPDYVPCSMDITLQSATGKSSISPSRVRVPKSLSTTHPGISDTTGSV